MTVDALIARMTQDAQARIAGLRAQADAEVAALEQARAEASAQDIERQLAKRRSARLGMYAAQRAQAQRQAAAHVLAAQHAMLDRVFARAASLAAQAGSDARYLGALPAYLAAVIGCLGAQPATLRCRPELARHLQPLLAGTPQLEIVADEQVPTGFVAATRDGRCTIDATLTGRLGALRPQLEASLLAQVPR